MLCKNVASFQNQSASHCLWSLRLMWMHNVNAQIFALNNCKCPMVFMTPSQKCWLSLDNWWSSDWMKKFELGDSPIHSSKIFHSSMSDFETVGLAIYAHLGRGLNQRNTTKGQSYPIAIQQRHLGYNRSESHMWSRYVSCSSTLIHTCVWGESLRFVTEWICLLHDVDDIYAIYQRHAFCTSPA